MRKIVLTIVLVISMLTISNAQDYKTGIGLRGGLESGITLKHFINRQDALEGLLSTRWGGFDITGLYEVHQQAFEVDRLNWYYGGGAHIGFYNGNTSWGIMGTSYTMIGVDGILGIEYNFREAPINISLDWKPVVNLFGETRFWGDTGGLSVRYIF